MVTLEDVDGRWKMGKCYIGLLEKYNTYGGRNQKCVFKRMELANRLICMVKYAAELSGIKYELEVKDGRQ